MKILILTCNTGEGHNSAAKAIAEQLERDGHSSVIKDALAFASPWFSKMVCESYRAMVLRTPHAMSAIYKISKKTANPKFKSLVYAATNLMSKKLYDVIIDSDIDAVICTHVFAAQAMSHIKKKRDPELPVYVVSTDYGFCPFFEEIRVDGYFIPMEMLRSDFLRRGVKSDKIIVSGIPVSGKFMHPMDKATAREQLGVASDARVCIVMSGSMGFGDIYDMLDRVIDDMPENTRIFVLAGNNKKLYDGVNEEYDGSVVTPVSFTNLVSVYMAAADVVVTKPGGLSSTEAMVSNTPLVLAKPIPGCESENYMLLTGIGAAMGGKKSRDAAAAVCALLGSEEQCEKIRQHQREFICQRSAEIICDTVTNKA